MEYAPVVIPTLCRSDHFTRLVKSLQNCSGAKQTELFIGIDYPTKPSHWDGYKIICEYCNSISGFKAVHIYVRETNLGENKNVSLLLQEVHKNGYDDYIFAEDDIEFSPNALEYLNQGLEKYKNDDRVLCICAYPHPDNCLELMQGYDKNCYCMKGYIAWGYACWFGKRDALIGFISSCKDIINSYKTVHKLLKGKKQQTVHRFLSRPANATSDLRKNAYCTLNDKYCIFPMVPKSRNWGFDGSGLNCTVTNMYEKRFLDTSNEFVMDDIEIGPNKMVDKVHNKYYSGGLMFRTIVYMEYLLFRMTGKKLRDFSIVKKMMRRRVKATNI